MNLTLSPTGSPEGNFPMSNIIDSLKRLERIGDDNSKTTQKLIQAAGDLAENIVKQFAAAKTEYIRLYPKGFREYAIDQGHLIFPESNLALLEGYVARDRENALAFSKDVANGLLDQLAEILAKRRADSEACLTAIENAKTKLE